MMNEHSFHDPQLRSFEAQLAAQTPQISCAEQQQILYQCGVAVGRSASQKSLRRWQAMTGVLVAAFVGLSFPRLSTDSPNAVQTAYPADRERISFPPRLTETGPRPTPPRHKSVDLSAWQTPSSDNAMLAHDLARFEQTEPHLRSLAVGALARTVLQNE
jgi:hypothetical protein